jgi:ferredoxin
VRLLKRNFRHRFRLARLTRLPLLGPLVDWMLFEGDDLVVLPKDRVVELQVNRQIEQPVNVVLPSEIVHRFIDQADAHFIMNFCICRESNACEDYPRDLGCLFMGEAAGRIDPRLGRLVTREEAHSHVSRAGEAGLVHLIGRNKLDSVWLDAWPTGRLLTVCNCCPCCCLWRMLPSLSPQIGAKVTRMEGVELRVTDGCVGCGACLDKCFVQAIEMVDGRAVIGDECRGCGRCAEACPTHAIAMTIPDASDLECTVRRVGDAVDVG